MNIYVYIPGSCHHTWHTSPQRAGVYILSMYRKTYIPNLSNKYNDVDDDDGDDNDDNNDDNGDNNDNDDVYLNVKYFLHKLLSNYDVGPNSTPKLLFCIVDRLNTYIYICIYTCM
jgi:hypothetical protein